VASFDVAKSGARELHLIWSGAEKDYNDTLWYQRSEDRGLTWSAPQFVGVERQDWMRVVPVPGKPHVVTGYGLSDYVLEEGQWHKKPDLLPEDWRAAMWWDAASSGDTLVVVACCTRRESKHLVDLVVLRWTQGRPLSPMVLHSWQSNGNIGPGPRILKKDGVLSLVASIVDTTGRAPTIYAWNSIDAGQAWTSVGQIDFDERLRHSMGGAEPDLVILDGCPHLRALFAFGALVEIQFQPVPKATHVIRLYANERRMLLRSVLASSVSASSLAAVVNTLDPPMNLLFLTDPASASALDVTPMRMSESPNSGAFPAVEILGDSLFLAQVCWRQSESKGMGSKSRVCVATIPVSNSKRRD